VDYKRKNMYILILTLGVIVGGLSLAYAALSATLNIQFGDITQNALTWNVGFQGSTVVGTAAGTSATGRVCGDATITATTVTVSATSLSKPEDKCTYPLTIKNSGTIAATLSSITPKNPNSTACSTSNGATMVCGNLTYKLTSDSSGNTILASNRLLAIGASLPVYLVVSYTGASLNATNTTQSGATFTLSYAQS